MTAFFKKLFKRAEEAQETEASQVTTEAGYGSIEAYLEPPQLTASCAQSVGMQRSHNEDALFSLTTTLAGNHSSPPFGLYIVADGMGGHLHGELASAIAVQVFAGHVVRRLYLPLLSYPAASPSDSIQDVMRSGVQEAHRVILKETPGGGTTLTAVLVMGEQVTIAHVGDSRAYSLIRDKGLQILTRDHSLVKRLIELGQLTQEEAAVHPQRNVLYRALGQGEPFDPDIQTFPLQPDGFLLMCSDGLWGVVPEEDIQRTILNASSLQQACQQLVDAANAAGGPDNITAILVHAPG